MAEIEFSVLRSACKYSDFILKPNSNSILMASCYCDNTLRVLAERGCERYCEESKCPLLVNKI